MAMPSPRRLFTVDEYYKMAEVGIIKPGRARRAARRRDRPDESDRVTSRLVRQAPHRNLCPAHWHDPSQRPGSTSDRCACRARAGRGDRAVGCARGPSPRTGRSTPRDRGQRYLNSDRPWPKAIDVLALVLPSTGLSTSDQTVWKCIGSHHHEGIGLLPCSTEAPPSARCSRRISLSRWPPSWAGSHRNLVTRWRETRVRSADARGKEACHLQATSLSVSAGRQCGAGSGGGGAAQQVHQGQRVGEDGVAAPGQRRSGPVMTRAVS